MKHVSISVQGKDQKFSSDLYIQRKLEECPHMCQYITHFLITKNKCQIHVSEILAKSSFKPHYWMLNL